MVLTCCYWTTTQYYYLFIYYMQLTCRQMFQTIIHYYLLSFLIINLLLPTASVSILTVYPVLLSQVNWFNVSAVLLLHNRSA